MWAGSKEGIILKKEYWLGIQNEILEGKGISRLWFFLFVVCFAIHGEPAALWYFVPLGFSVLSLGFLGVIWHVCKQERSRKDSRELLFNIVIFIGGAVISLYRILQ